MSNKIDLDKYYTPKSLAEYCTSKMFEYTGGKVLCIEPSCGNGSFIPAIKSSFQSYLFLDIEPEHKEIAKQNYLSFTPPTTDSKVVVLGNPPFGYTNTMSVKFFKHSIKFADYIGFILPISQHNNNKQMYDFDLIYSEDLGLQKYSDRSLHCCFNIYKKPESGKLNKKVKVEVEGLTVKEHRRDKSKPEKDIVPPKYFHSICSWGNGSLGKMPDKVGQYAMELYFYSDDIFIKDVVLNINWHDELSCIAAKKLPKGLAIEIIKNKVEVEVLRGNK